VSELEDCCGISPCEPLLLEAGKWGTAIVRELESKGNIRRRKSLPEEWRRQQTEKN
jgi:hypothetical protein